MGYTTYFNGGLEISGNLLIEQIQYINQFSKTRRVKRDVDRCVGEDDPIRESVGLPLGEDAGYFVGDENYSVLEYNHQPTGQPYFWCHWIIKGNQLVWNGVEAANYNIVW